MMCHGSCFTNEERSCACSLDSKQALAAGWSALRRFLLCIRALLLRCAALCIPCCLRNRVHYC